MVALVIFRAGLWTSHCISQNLLVIAHGSEESQSTIESIKGRVRAG